MEVAYWCVHGIEFYFKQFYQTTFPVGVLLLLVFMSIFISRIFILMKSIWEKPVDLPVK
jgi:hypothetical protein